MKKYVYYGWKGVLKRVGIMAAVFIGFGGWSLYFFTNNLIKYGLVEFVLWFFLAFAIAGLGVGGWLLWYRKTRPDIIFVCPHCVRELSDTEIDHSFCLVCKKEIKID